MTQEIASPESRTKELGNRFAELRRQKQRIEQELQETTDEIAAVEQELRPCLEELGADSLKLAGVGTLYLATDFHASVEKGREDELNRWLDEHGHGSLAQRRVHAQTLKSQFRQWVDGDQPLPPADLVRVHSEVRVRLRQAA